MIEQLRRPSRLRLTKGRQIEYDSSLKHDSGTPLMSLAATMPPGDPRTRIQQGVCSVRDSDGTLRILNVQNSGQDIFTHESLSMHLTEW